MINAYNGMIMAELILLPGTFFTSTNASILRTIIAYLFFILGLYLASYPELRPELSYWSKGLANTINSISPAGMDQARLSTSLGTILIMYGVLLSDSAKRFLSHPFFTKLGQISLGIFLLHMAVVRTVFVWLLYGIFSGRPTDEKTGLPISDAMYAMPTKPYRFFAAIISLGVVLYVADLWHTYLDPWFLWAIEKIDERIFSSDLPLTLPKSAPISQTP
jgi:hypothetical protein